MTVDHLFKDRKHFLRRSIYITGGVLSTTFGLNAFVLNNGLIDGGVTGISLLTSRLTGIPLPVLIIGLSLPFAFLASKLVNTMFAVRSMVAVALLVLGLVFLDFPQITQDMWLISVFGGFFIGAGMAMVMRGGAVLDGTEIISVYFSKSGWFSASEVNLVLNILLFAITAWLLNIETALYSILTYFSNNKTVEYLTEGIEAYVGVTIISDKYDEIRAMIIEKLGRGVTMYHGEMGHGKRGQVIKQTKILYTVITRLELSKLQQEISMVDDQAFTIISNINDTKGGMIKKRPVQKRGSF